MSLEILAVGVNHTTAPVELRERLATATDAVAVLLPRMVADLGLAEAMVLSTCNRVEIYALTERWAQTGDRVLEFLAGERGVPAGQLRQSSFVRGAGDGVRHIFRVAASLESMVVG
ncbi:MAG: glutamyl-tRNA reductase, partial [Myxococcales bacterium]|nr:glutamyl-tRNA reductase [Myxococcales bacterium]